MSPTNGAHDLTRPQNNACLKGEVKQMEKNKELDIKKLLGESESASLPANDTATEEDLRRLRKMKLIKLGTASVISAVILIFMTMQAPIKQMTA